MTIEHTKTHQQITESSFDTVIAGGGIAGLVTALELLLKGQRICIVDRDTPERLGGLARWAFGGMALCNTHEQKRMNIPDSTTKLLTDWHSFAEFNEQDYWPKLWANEYAKHNHDKVYLWLKSLGLKFLPAVNWVERGLYTPGNSVPRYHVLWGTGWGLVEKIIEQLTPYLESKQLTVLHQHKVVTLIQHDEKVAGVNVIKECSAKPSSTKLTSTKQSSTPSLTTSQPASIANTNEFSILANNTVIACGGINGSIERVKQNWQSPWPDQADNILNGANPISDGDLHDEIANIGGNITRAEHMWNYAAGIKHPQAEFKGHGLSLIPSKSALWLNHQGERIGPMPLITGFDTHDLCQQVAKQEKPWTWQVLTWDMAIKELAVSGSLHNPSIRDKKYMSFAKEILLGNTRLVHQLIEESDDVLVGQSLEALTKKMNASTSENFIADEQIATEVSKYNAQFADSAVIENDDQIRRIHHARQWRPDKLRTCKPTAIKAKRSDYPYNFIAIKLRLISRKSLGGIQTNLASQVLNNKEQPIQGLYCVGEAAGFGGGGANGKRSLEGTFLSACILTARNAAQSIQPT